MSAAVDSDIAPVAALMADRARAAMLTALLDGQALSAGELARTSAVTAQTASGHLAKLLDGGLVTVVKQGRYRYYRLSGPEVAEVIEALSRISPPIEVRSLRQSRQARDLRHARTCYDHLAGQAGVALLDSLVVRGLIEPGGEGSYGLTAKGEERLGDLGIDLVALRAVRRCFAADCLDWTERRPHLRGALAKALTDRLIELGWFDRGRTRRALVLTGAGRVGLQDSFGCVLPDPG